MKNRIICINRKYGSAGSEIGRLAAEKLGIRFYDRDLLKKAIEYGDLDKSKALEKFIESEETAPNRFTYRLYDTGNEHTQKQSPAADIIFDLEKQLIEKAAEESDCIIIGRCAGDILEKAGYDTVNVFITASADYRAEYIDMNSDTDISRKTAEKQIETVDRHRAEFFRNYTGKAWDSAESYDIVINSESLGVDGAVEILCGIYSHMI